MKRLKDKNMKDIIYADNAATTKLSQKALEAMMPYLCNEYGNPSSLHRMGQSARRAMGEARQEIAGVLNCSTQEVTFTSGGTEANNQAILTAISAKRNKRKKHIISTGFEHHSILHMLKKLEQNGYEVTLLDIPGDGLIRPQQVEEALREDTCLVSVMYANNEIGSIQPIAEIGSICREHDILFHTDAVQAAGHLPIDVKELSVNLLSISAHKFHGPKGIGLLYAAHGIHPANLLEGGAQERGHRSGTENVAAIAGMAAALREADRDREANNERTAYLRDRLIEGLEKIPHSILNGSREKRLPGNVNFCFEGIEGETLLLLLDQEGICASSGSACSAGSLEASHVLLALGRPRELAFGSLRLSINEENNEEEINRIIEVVTDSVVRLRESSPMWHDLLSGRKAYYI